MDFSIITNLLNIIFINLILSGDNAVVIAMAAMGLQEKSRKKAIVWGATLAVVLRISLTFVAALLLKIPIVQFVGGLLLTFIAVNLLKPGEKHVVKNQESNFAKAILTILWADVIMSLDNVLAIAGAAKGNPLMLVLGLAISIPIVLAGSTLLTKLMEKFSWLSYAGAGILAYTASEMILSDRFIEQYISLIPFAGIIIPVVLIAIVILLGKRARSRALPKQVDESPVS